MTLAYRQNLHGVTLQSTTHPGLWLDRFLSGYSVVRDNDKPHKTLVDAVADVAIPESYRNFYERWNAALEQMGVTRKIARANGRLSIGLGGESVLETAISLHRTYGVPYIPGSALKGLAAGFARQRLEESEWGKDSNAYRVLFGDTTTAGYVTFYDALYVPGTGHRGKPLWPDVITVHHPEYYQGGNPPADWDSPTPIPFLSATGDYLLAIGGDDQWVEAAFDILRQALKEEGIGAKTSSGYGRMRFADDLSAAEDSADAAGEPYAVTRRRLLKEEELAPGRLRGTVADVKRDGDFGFINPATGGATVFVHRSQVRTKGKTLRIDQVVEYEIGTYKGKEQAQNVDVLLDPA